MRVPGSNHRQRDVPNDLARQCEAYLAGRFAHFVRRGREPPPWAWFAVLAHADEDEVEAIASAGLPDRRIRRSDSWDQALAFLAQEMLCRATDAHQGLRDLQRSVLVPLELELAAHSTWPTEPAAFVGVVLSALRPKPRNLL